MHLPPNLFSSILYLSLVIAVVGNNDSNVYFPIDDADRPSYSAFSVQNSDQQLQPVATADLASLRGTSIYEKYVDDIIAKSITRLTIEVNKLLKSQKKSSENVLFSPMSITGALALVFLGSNGLTFKQISEFWGLHIGIPDIDKKSQIVHEQLARMLHKINRTSGFQLGEEINVASAIFVQEGYPIRPIYKSIAEDLYLSSILNVDFEINPEEAQNRINSWVSDKTHKKINTILSDVPTSATKVILASALYFKAEWEHHFFPGSTRRRPFYIDGRQSNTNIEVEMMSNGGEFPYHKDFELGCEILGLPYKGNRSTMYIIMPFDSSREKLQEFESRITEPDLNNLVRKTTITGTVLLFPKMKIETTIDLKQTLKMLGLTSLFNPLQANLALLSPGRVTPKTQFTIPTSINQENIIGSSRSRKNIDINTGSSLGNEALNMNSRIGSSQSIDNIRQLINEQSSDNNYQNPGLYADQVIHKVFMDITEKGTEAAAATSVSLSRDGSRVTFRADVPFCFFIRHDETNTILFWGSVVIPNPSYQKF